MKNKGFTLIELLAVIVVLAIIVLIAVPTISKVVEKSRKGAALSSAYGYIDAVEKAIVLNQIKQIEQIADGEYELPMDDKYSVKVKGSLPEEGKIVIEKSKIKTGEMCINDYIVEYENGKAEVMGKCAERPQLVKDSLKVTLADGTEFTKVQEYGTPVKVTFKTSVKGGKIKSVNSPEGATLNASTGEITYTTTGNEMNLTFEVIGNIGEDESIGKIKISLGKYYETIIEADSLLKAVEENEIGNDSTGKIIVNGVTYSVHTYYHDGNLTISEDTEYGDASDVATSSSNAKRMVILKVNGNLTINEGAILTTVKSADGYGGPKGFLIYATGDITNNGTISMTARGAKAEGQDVYLWKNGSDNYEVVPSLGATGGIANDLGSGSDGSLRSTGGGGAGGSTWNVGNRGLGSQGTSYSGGSGGGSVDNVWKGKAGSGNGAAGGDAIAGNSSGWETAGGGAGNPGGTGAKGANASWTGLQGSNGTGGLLIAYAKSFVNNGIVESNGSDGGTGNAGGGSSGGGSINIFYKNNLTQGNINASGGSRTGTSSTNFYKGGSGGTGSIAIGKIANGTYTDTYHNWTD